MEQFNFEAWRKSQVLRYNRMIQAGLMPRQSYREEKLTLLDGTLVILPEDESKWINSQITFEDGTLLPPGEYTLASSLYSSEQQITVGPDGIITKVATLENKGIQRLENKIAALKKFLSLSKHTKYRTAAEINNANSILHGELSTAYGPMPIDAALDIGEALSELPLNEYDDLDFSAFDISNYLKLYEHRNKRCMQWMWLTYDTARNQIRLVYKVI